MEVYSPKETLFLTSMVLFFLLVLGSHLKLGKGELSAKKLSNFLEKRLQNERGASIWTSTLQRTILTANQIVGFPKMPLHTILEIQMGVTGFQVKRHKFMD